MLTARWYVWIINNNVHFVISIRLMKSKLMNIFMNI